MYQTDSTRLFFTAFNAFQSYFCSRSLLFYPSLYVPFQLVGSLDRLFVEFRPETAFGISLSQCGWPFVGWPYSQRPNWKPELGDPGLRTGEVCDLSGVLSRIFLLRGLWMRGTSLEHGPLWLWQRRSRTLKEPHSSAGIPFVLLLLCSGSTKRRGDSKKNKPGFKITAGVACMGW